MSNEALKIDQKSGNIRQKNICENKIFQYIFHVCPDPIFCCLPFLLLCHSLTHTHTHTHTHRKRPEKDCVSEKDSVEKEGESELSLAACV